MGESADAVSDRWFHGFARGRPAVDLDAVAALDGVRSRLLSMPRAGVRLSRYVLIERLAAGGLGTVYTAYDPELDRKVAVKVLHADQLGAGSSEDRIAELVHEAQAIARVSHPNVVTVFDVGVSRLGSSGSGPAPDQPFVYAVMELVEGPDVGTWLDRNRPPWRESLRVLRGAGQGLAAVHTAGLVHRDFKPANVVVDGNGRALVIDFGLARVATPVRREGADSGKAPLGTAAYMSPEQHRGEVATARSDQFSYCSTLYEAFHGVRPFAGSTLDALRRAKERGERQRGPSSDRVPAWIDAVLTRGMHPIAGERFGSMDQLLGALERDPVARRRKWALRLGAGALTGAIASAAAVEMAAVDPRDQCQKQAQRARMVWNDQRRAEIGEAFSRSGVQNAAEVWETVAPRIDDYMSRWVVDRIGACVQDVDRAASGATERGSTSACLDRHLTAVSGLSTVLAEVDATVVRNAGMAVSHLPPLSACETVNPDPEPIAETPVRAELHRIRALRWAGSYRRAQAAAERVIGAGSSLPDDVLALALLELGRVAIALGHAERAEEALHRALSAAERAGAQETSVDVLVRLIRVIGYDLGRPVEAQRWAALAQSKVDRQSVGYRLESELLGALGLVRLAERRHDDAIDLFRRGLATLSGPAEPSPRLTASLHNNLGVVFYDRGDMERAVHHYTLSMQDTIALAGDRHPQVATMLGNLGAAAADRGDVRGAIEHYRGALDRLEAADGLPERHAAVAHQNLGNALVRLERYQEALHHQDLSLALMGPPRGGVDALRLNAVVNRAITLRAMGRVEEAAEAVAAVWQSIESEPSRFSEAARAETRAEMASLALVEGRLEEAVAMAEQALSFIELAHPGLHRELPRYAARVAEIHLAAGRADLARPDLERAVVVGRARPANRLDLAAAEFALARAVEDVEPGRASVLARSALGAYQSAGAHPSRRRVIEHWLARRERIEG